MSELEAHHHFFKADWIREPSLLAEAIRTAKLNDRFTAEIAAWCAEIHEHLRELEGQLGIKLMLMGGNGASLRFDAVQQRGSRDNDYLTVASKQDVTRLMESFAERFATIPGYLQPSVYKPKRPVRELDMVSYEIPVPLRLNHGKAKDNRVKMEFHFEQQLPPAETIRGELGPARGVMTARLPGLPYQTVFKLMTLARDPVGIDEEYRGDSVPRQLYDLDLLLAALTTQDQWQQLVDYCQQRYAVECLCWDVAVSAREPFDGIRERLLSWGDCVDETGDRWQDIRAMQQAQLHKAVHLDAWGWRGRIHRLVVAAECLRLGVRGRDVWHRALDVARLVPTEKAKAYRGPLAALAGEETRNLPLQLHDYVWEILAATEEESLPTRVERVGAELARVGAPAAR